MQLALCFCPNNCVATPACASCISEKMVAAERVYLFVTLSTHASTSNVSDVQLYLRLFGFPDDRLLKDQIINKMIFPLKTCLFEYFFTYMKKI